MEGGEELRGLDEVLIIEDRKGEKHLPHPQTARVRDDS